MGISRQVLAESYHLRHHRLGPQGQLLKSQVGKLVLAPGGYAPYNLGAG